jgi:hypothetical protein
MWNWFHHGNCEFGLDMVVLTPWQSQIENHWSQDYCGASSSSFLGHSAQTLGCDQCWVRLQKLPLCLDSPNITERVKQTENFRRKNYQPGLQGSLVWLATQTTSVLGDSNAECNQQNQQKMFKENLEVQTFCCHFAGLHIWVFWIICSNWEC